ncbi:MAG: T9SS type A sorting domain-containing protein [Bacteroidetes bacterium]|nr:T9SS type A sorting domain-containing protein [Bacteroidota bacterium]
MKYTYLLFIILLVSPFIGRAQMVEEHTYPSTMANVGIMSENGGISVIGPVLIDLAVSGRKYAVCEANSLNLYNLDHTLWKSIPLQAVGYATTVIFFISENLFKLDGKVEYAVSYTPASGSPTMYVMDEDGNTLNTINGMYWMYLYKSAPDTTKAITTLAYQASSAKVFALPGNLPCKQCVNNNNLNVGHYGPAAAPMLSDPVPNPANGMAMINYTLPAGVADATITLFNTQGQEIRNYKATQGGQNVAIETSTLPQGIYYYSLRTNAGNTTARKMLVVK